MRMRVHWRFTMSLLRMYVYSQAQVRRANHQVMFSTTLEVEKQLQQVIKQLYEKVSHPLRVSG
jgi:hypothetical protein